MDKNSVKIEKKGLHPRFTHLTFPNGSRVTECVLENSKKEALSKGFSICSNRDIFNKAEGRAISLGRAVAALEHKKSLYPIDREDNEICIALKGSFKAEYIKNK
jgi:hypothetical protein